MKILNQDGTTAGFVSASYSTNIDSICSWCGKPTNVHSPNNIICYGWGYFDCMECFIKYQENEERLKRKAEQNET